MARIIIFWLEAPDIPEPFSRSQCRRNWENITQDLTLEILLQAGLKVVGLASGSHFLKASNRESPPGQTHTVRSPGKIESIMIRNTPRRHTANLFSEPSFLKNFAPRES